MPPITLLPAAARLLPVVFPVPPEPSIIAAEPLGSKTEFLRLWSFLDAAPPPVLFISEISPTLGNALEFLHTGKLHQLWRTVSLLAKEFKFEVELGWSQSVR